MQHNSAHLPSRRTFITGSALGLTALALAGCDRAPSPAPTSSSPTALQLPPAPTTLDARLVPGGRLRPKMPYRLVAVDTGQPLFVREDLCQANPKRSSTRTALASFGQITDTHIMDPTSPAHTVLGLLRTSDTLEERQSYLYRPQDALTVHVMDAMIRRLNAVRIGPIAGRPFDFYVSTGDSSDRRGTNEVLAFIETLNGDKTSTFAFPGLSTSVQSPIALPDEIARFVWQPVPSKNKTPSRIWQDTYGFPVSKEFLASASKLITTGGSNVPWYSGFGNHDALIKGVGNFGTPNEIYYSYLSTADKIPLGLPEGMDFASFMKEIKSPTEPHLKEILASMPGRVVKPSAERRPMTKTEFMSAHLVNTGPHGPVGHGFTAENVRSGKAYYRFKMADGIIGIMLDTTDSTGGGQGSIDGAQAQWLEKELRSASSIQYDKAGKRRRRNVQDQLVVLFSHHPSRTFGPQWSAGFDSQAVTSSHTVLELLAGYPNVILWVSGHMHSNNVWPRASRMGNFGFWEVNTASHIDFPQQARSIEIIDNNDGTLSIAGVMVDHSDPVTLDYTRSFSATQLAAFSAELALNSPAPNVLARSGTDKDQNVELLLKKPF
ncbi:TIGR03767 family metallophosphoesterase [Arthrobacter sp. BF1]|uniref:TIGR03767 family metallophosphoesterase n=1 Tax=Arthrobacter sp. BF1 TaxID=2821145 RepID=UPI00277D0F27|nr:TIGR03767 family metallophosphoesterase [Arthrobacter sp. BF1]